MTSPSRMRTQRIGRHVMISGTVQGVGFREALCTLARALHIQGWCRNVNTGHVEAKIIGSPEAVAELLEWLHKGPDGAIVEKVEIENQAVLDTTMGQTVDRFEIRK